MSAAGEPRRLGLEVRFDAKPIQGRLYDQKDHGRLDRPFSGWLGLMAAIEAARGGHPDDHHKPPSGRDDLHGPAVCLDDRLHDGQSEPGAH
jgi:hypothetical protein